MKRALVATTVLLCLLSARKLAAQTSNASVGGFVQDSSQAFIPGATVKATNTQTGVLTSVLTNEAGAYNIPSLLPGTYRLSAELLGFRSHIYNDVVLGAGVAARYNFVLEVGEVTSAVEVTADRSAAIAQSSASIGQVLTADVVRDLPIVTNNVLDLMRTMAGVRGDGLGTGTTFAGISTAFVNTTRDGISVQENRYNLGVTSTTVINPDLVGEMRVILTPVDAETGRGNGQVQILTRSGTNRYNGAAVWAVRNSALDANTWSNNRNAVPIQPDWVNRHQATVSYGGPIIKNKTFFFALYDQQIERRRETQFPIVLTDCARNGIFRYWEGWANGNTNTPVSTVGANPTRPSVDALGNPTNVNPSGGQYGGQLRFFSVFGPVTNTPTQPDCSDAVVQGAPWNSLRAAMDPIGLTQKFLAVMPHANRFEGGDGLNTAQHQWERRSHNTGSLNLASGSENDTDRKQINIKFDHQFNSNHKAAVNYSYDWTDGDYLLSSWPGGYTSQLVRRPQVLTANVTSTLTPRLLNEAHIGYRQNYHVIWAPWEVTDPEKREVPLSMLLAGSGFPIAVQLATIGTTTLGTMNTNNFSCFTNCAQQGNKTPLYQFGDTLSWSRGKHAFKGGGEFRYGYSRGSETPSAPIPKAFGGGGLNPNTAFTNNSNLPGLVSNNQALADSLLYFLSGSLSTVQQYYFIQTPDHHNQWLDYNSTENHRKITDSRQKEFSLFFKDDWKVNPRLTLNLGIRYDYYGVPYENQGLTAVPVGGGNALFGVSGRSFDNWMNPNAGVDMNLVTTLEFVGPKTANPAKTAYKKDSNNFGPAIGFAWQLPWFGEGKTNVRGGYQITYAGGGRYVNLANYIFNNQGYVFLAQSQGPVDGSYFDTTDLSGLVPIAPSTLPMQPIPVHKRNVDAWAFDNNYVAPYIQNFTLSVTRDITRKVNLDVRYIGTRGVKLLSDLFNLNTANVYYNPVLLDALERTRAGEDVLLFDQMFLGLNLGAGGTVNGTTQRGSEHLRRSTTFRSALANGDFETVADALNIFNGTGSSQVNGAAGERGTVLRRANRGFNVTGGTTVPGGIVVPAGLFPENWIVSNPQFDEADLFSNSGSSNYHSLQVQATLRPTYGLSVQGTYVWSKAIAVPTTGYTNPADRQKDYALATQHVTHDFRAFGTFELPIGPNKLFFPNSSGWVARLIERWQSSFIFNMNTGQPASITAGNMLYGNGVADLVAPLSLRKGNVHWGDPGPSGTLVGGYFESGTFGKVDDPQCGQIAASLQQFCTLEAVTSADTGEIVLQNPRPGTRGTVGRQTMELPGRWTFDASMSKTFQLAESRSLQVRFDATNILNHPLPGTPTLSINSSNPFGYIASKGNQRREFRGQLRLTF
jgi:hypothetical protein